MAGELLFIGWWMAVGFVIGLLLGVPLGVASAGRKMAQQAVQRGDGWPPLPKPLPPPPAPPSSGYERYENLGKYRPKPLGVRSQYPQMTDVEWDEAVGNHR